MADIPCPITWHALGAGCRNTGVYGQRQRSRIVFTLCCEEGVDGIVERHFSGAASFLFNIGLCVGTAVQALRQEQRH